MRVVMVAMLAAIVLAMAFAGGCSAISRESALRARGAEIEKKLLKERELAVMIPPDSTVRQAKLDHLTKLRETLSAVNIARGAVKDAVPMGFRGVAYDAVEEAYGNIEWNIPLMPTEARQSLPMSIKPDGSFNLGAMGADQPPGIR